MLTWLNKPKPHFKNSSTGHAGDASFCAGHVCMAGALQDAGLPLLGFSCSLELHLFAHWRQGKGQMGISGVLSSILLV